MTWYAPIGHGNVTQVELLEDGAIWPESSQIIRIDVVIGGQAYSSEDYPEAIKWTEFDVSLKLGLLGPPPGLHSRASLVVYIPGYPNGIEWLGDDVYAG